MACYELPSVHLLGGNEERNRPEGQTEFAESQNKHSSKRSQTIYYLARFFGVVWLTGTKI